MATSCCTRRRGRLHTAHHPNVHIRHTHPHTTTHEAATGRQCWAVPVLSCGKSHTWRNGNAATSRRTSPGTGSSRGRRPAPTPVPALATHRPIALEPLFTPPSLADAHRAHPETTMVHWDTRLFPHRTQSLQAWTTSWRVAHKRTKSTMFATPYSHVPTRTHLRPSFSLSLLPTLCICAALVMDIVCLCGFWSRRDSWTMADVSAIARIAELETALASERHKNRGLTAEVTRLRSTVERLVCVEIALDPPC